MKRYKSGFTLVELLVVMAIIGILSVVTLANFSTSQAKGRDAQRKSDLKQISIALEAYYADHGAYPVGTAGKIMACGCATLTPCVYIACSWGGTSNREFIDENNTVYMKEIPNDSVSSRQYYYVSDKKSWQLYAVLENTNDMDQLPIASRKTFASTVYNFGISSSNSIP
jgi:prepilin-type N-terminal cleavage/methylation domain-containing protein